MIQSYERYQRQVILKGFGESGQQKLLLSKVLVIGAGGLGCPALQYLAAAGVGNIGIVDDDTVALTDLHRQILYTTFDIGFFKAEKAKQRLTKLNPGISILAYNERLTTQNALSIISAYDIIIDGTDNFSSRYIINDACVLLNKPLVYGAVSRFEGQVAIFNYQAGNNSAPVNYRDLFPVPPTDGEILNCAETGVLGVLPGIIGTMQANETIKLITGIGKALINSLFTYNALDNSIYEILLSAKKDTRSLIPFTEDAFKKMDYDWLCSSSTSRQFEIDGETFNRFLDKSNIDIIDVREPDELPLLTEFNHMKIPLQQLKEKAVYIKNETIVVFCLSGKRSLKAAQWLSDRFGNSKKIFSLQGGIADWLKNNASL